MRRYVRQVSRLGTGYEMYGIVWCETGVYNVELRGNSPLVVTAYLPAVIGLPALGVVRMK